jgi:hypothetical protein
VNNSPRDTQFAGFAKALWEELRDAGCTAAYYDPDPVFRNDALEIIARRAYDLVVHAIECLDCKGCESVEWVSDLPVLPEEKQ